MGYIKKFNENWEDPYKVLGLNPKSNINDIKKAYRKIAFQNLLNKPETGRLNTGNIDSLKAQDLEKVKNG